ncbi:MAG: hypothetical protein PUD98_05260, partial [Bacteroidales bacterium]|nr:hypothetical protein [Bacteroidales bacterium]
VPSCKSGRYVLLLQSDLKSVFFVVYYGFQPIFNQVGAPTGDLSSLDASFEEIRAKRYFFVRFFTTLLRRYAPSSTDKSSSLRNQK